MFGRRNFKKNKTGDIDPDEIFLDSKNLPRFDTHQFEGRLEKPIARTTIAIFASTVVLVGVFLIGRVSYLQVAHGKIYREQSENNRLDNTIIFSERGVIYDRNHVPLAWNKSSQDEQNIIHASSSSHNSIATSSESVTDESVFPLRAYAPIPGLAQITGFVTYPQKDKQGNYFQDTTVGRAGVEKVYDQMLTGIQGKKIVERSALGDLISESVIQSPQEGKALTLTIDSRIQGQLYLFLEELAHERGFSGGGSIILDVQKGDVLALASYPSYDSQIMTDGDDSKTIKEYNTDSSTPFVNRVIAGTYTPGSIMKPFFAIGALTEKVIDPLKTIYSDGAFEVPNPYDSEHPTVFKDWKAHGAVDLRHALAVSSNIYFFAVGGGSPADNQRGIGIEGIEKYAKLFKIGDPTGIDLLSEVSGVVPSKAWKEKNFPGDPWRLGDTYNSSIGQYGFLVTPIQMARAAAAIANNGYLVTPRVVEALGAPSQEHIDVDPSILQIVREGMRMVVTEGTGVVLNIPQAHIAAKSGTAELGSTKQKVNSWIIGFWPYENPRYAFATVMERGPAQNTIGSGYVMQRLFNWMVINTPEYLR